MNDKQDFWDEFDKMAQEAGGGGGGAICYATILTGFKVYASGMSNDDTFFPTPHNDKEEIAAAKKKAQKLCNETDAGFPKWGVNIIADRNRYYVQGAQRVYDNDRHFFRTHYNETRDNRKYAMLYPALSGLGIKCVPPWKGWIRLGFPPDPWAVEQGPSAMKQAPDGTMRYQPVEIPVEVFANEAEAMKAVGEMPTGGGEDSLPSVPDGYTDEDWATLVDSHITGMAQDKLDSRLPKAAVVASLSKEFGVDPSYIQAIVDNIVPM